MPNKSLSRINAQDKIVLFPVDLSADVRGALNSTALSFKYVNKTANYTLHETDTVVRVDATSGAVTVALPAAATVAGMIFIIRKVDSSGNAVTIDPNGAETIDGAATKSLATQWASAMIMSNSISWDVI